MVRRLLQGRTQNLDKNNLVPESEGPKTAVGEAERR